MADFLHMDPNCYLNMKPLVECHEILKNLNVVNLLKQS